MMALRNVGNEIHELNARIGGIATALVARNGVVLFADLPAGVPSETFAIMCATLFGAAATAGAELNRRPPDRILIEGSDSTTVLVGKGEKALLVAVVDRSVDLARVLEEVGKLAERLLSS
ncbi:MAG TPA: roadblock/LC7 domain-containing protein [Thermoplasmata archaeon]|nr:roadblock/LC7 domain-containing protein [Thermoplasmata archaeon]